MNRSNTEFVIFILAAIIVIFALTFFGGSAALQEQLYNAVVMTLWLGAAVILLARAFDYTTPGDWMVTIQEGVQVPGRVLLLLGWLFSGFVWLSAPHEVLAFGEPYKSRFDKELRWIIKQKPRYVWGGTSDVTGIDCSGYMWVAAKRAGIPVCRTTSKNMALGRDGWTSTDITGKLCHAEEYDFIFWTWAESPNRPDGHVGCLLRNQDTDFPGVTHSSSKRGVVVDTLQGKLIKDLSKVRRLTIGDKK